MYEFYIEEINKEIQKYNHVKASELFMKLIQKLLNKNDKRSNEFGGVIDFSDRILETVKRYTV